MKGQLLTRLAIALVLLFWCGESIAMATSITVKDGTIIAQTGGDDGCPGDPDKDC